MSERQARSRATCLKVAVLLLAAPPASVSAQVVTETPPVSVSVGAARTDGGNGALRWAIDMLSNGFSREDVQLNLNNGFFYFSPEASIEAGDADVFSSMVVRLTGSFAFFRTTTVAGIETPDLSFFHALPIAISAETDRAFQNVNVLAEAGYSPWFQGAVAPILRQVSVGVFVQGGYKFRLETTNAFPDADSTASGASDETSEEPQSVLFRVKGSLRLRPQMLLSVFNDAFGVGIGGRADTWFDIANGDTYYRAEGTFRVKLIEGRFLDFAYQKGSGAPLFNSGDQFSANLTVMF